jgi:hypothetical protein
MDAFYFVYVIMPCQRNAGTVLSSGVYWLEQSKITIFRGQLILAEFSFKKKSMVNEQHANIGDTDV